MKPSASAILIPADNVEGVLALVDQAFRTRGFRPWSKTLPAGYPLRRDEWFDFGVGLQTRANAVLILPSDVESVFRVCVVLSSTLGHPYRWIAPLYGDGARHEALSQRQASVA